MLKQLVDYVQMPDQELEQVQALEPVLEQELEQLGPVPEQTLE